MTYNQAKEMGNALDGYVMCTFAEIFNLDKDKKPSRFFSVQAPKKNEWQKGTIGDAYRPAVDQTVSFIHDVPAFIATKMVDVKSRMDFVPVKLSEHLFAFMFGDGKGNGGVIKSSWRHYDENGKLVNEDLTKGISRDTVWYVKAGAVDWMPTNIANAQVDIDGASVDLDDAIKKAKQDIERAKMLLVLSGAAGLIV